MTDKERLDAAVALAEPQLGTTADNPTVGAIVVDREGRIVGQAVTAPGGRPHAETQALAAAGHAAAGATLYVTLEPCNHYGRTPPCTLAIMAADIARVVVGVLDADPRTAGEGIERLKHAGIDVTVLDHIGSARLHEGFLTRQRLGRPFVTAKLAVSPDGMIGRHGEPNVAITGDVAREWTHRLRARSDAILVGSGTASIDSPKLTVRLPGLEDRRPRRIVLVGEHRLDPDLRILQEGEPPAEVLPGKPAPIAALKVLGREGVNALLVEGGAGVIEALLAAGLIDRFHLLEGTQIVGQGGVPATPHGSIADRLGAAGFAEVDRRALGDDNLRTFERA